MSQFIFENARVSGMAPPSSSGNVLDHRSLPPVFEYRPGLIFASLPLEVAKTSIFQSSECQVETHIAAERVYGERCMLPPKFRNSDAFRVICIKLSILFVMFYKHFSRLSPFGRLHNYLAIIPLIPASSPPYRL